MTSSERSKRQPETFAARLRAAIDADKRSVAQIALAAGLGRTTIYNLLGGVASDPPWSTVQALSRAMGLSTEWFRCAPK